MLCQQNARDYIQYSTVRLMRMQPAAYAVYVCVPCGCHMTADTAQPRKRSGQALSHLWMGSGNETSLFGAQATPSRTGREKASLREAIMMVGIEI